VTTFRSVRPAEGAVASAAPHSEQNLALGSFSWPQEGQALTQEA
jgi:hypothetical protein